MKDDVKMKLNRIFNYYGFRNQCHKLIEEMAELIQAIEKEESKENIIEEMADVQIILLQLRMNLNQKDRRYFADCFNLKIERQVKRIEKSENV